jgi:hypothetical protein
MKQLFIYLRRLFVFCIPFIIVVIVYILYDPFMVLHKYEDYNKKMYIPKNRDFISTETYLNNRQKYNYDSFIFGSSTALFVPPSIWKQYLSKTNSVFSFDASRENIVGIWSKMKYIDKKHQHIKNALFVIDYDKVFSKLDRDNVLFIKHYKVLRSSWFDFQSKNFLNILNPFFLRALISYNVSKEFKPFMKEFLIDETSYIDPVTNEYHCSSVMVELKTDSLKYYADRKEKFPSRNGIYREYKSQINKDQIQMLTEMKEILDGDKTDYRIIISPNYEQVYFNKSDLDILDSIFGKKNVLDFSGVNKFSDEMSNFYDGLHFKAYVGIELLDVAYSSGTKE